MLFQEPTHDVGPERVTNAAVVLTPALQVLFRIRPQKVAEQADLGDVCGPHNTADLVHALEVRAQPAVHGQDLLVNDGGDRQAVEAVRECAPELDVVSALALVVEPVDAVHAGTLVVAAQNKEVLRVLDFVREQKADRLQTLLAAVDIVAEKQVVRLRGEATVLKKAQQVVVLPVDVAADLDGRLELEQNGLLDEDFARLRAEPSDLALLEMDIFARTRASDL